jgi:membrane protease YdiL (CAAX protease family)
MTPSPPPSKSGIALRVGLYALIGWLTLVISATLMVWILGRRDSLFVIAALSVFAAAAVANAIAVRVYERGRLSDLGLGWTPTALREFLTGAGIAAGAAALILTGAFAVGAAHFEPVPASEHPWSSLIFVVIVLLFGAAGEEMLFHGYAFQLLIRSLGAFATILPFSIIFGFAHLGNQNASNLGILNTILWGVLLGYAYWRTKALWLPIGLHFGWNFALPLFGVNLSGFTMNVMGYALRWRAGDLWSGGGYGPEGSVLTTAVVMVLFFAVHRVIPERLQE